jgi:hypothetical protein
MYQLFVWVVVRRNAMRTTLVALSFAAGIGLAGAGAANAAPAAGAGLANAAATASPLTAVQYSEHRTRHGVVKCYRDLVVGPYRCHHFRNGELSVPF